MSRSRKRYLKAGPKYGTVWIENKHGVPQPLPHQVQLSKEKEAAIRAICSDDGFLQGIKNIAGHARRWLDLDRKGDIERSEVRPTLEDFLAHIAQLREDCGRLPNNVRWALCAIGKCDGYPDHELEKRLMDLENAVSRTLAKWPRQKTRVKAPPYQEHMALALCELFSKFQLPFAASASKRLEPNPAIICLQIVFVAAGGGSLFAVSPERAGTYVKDAKTASARGQAWNDWGPL